MCTGSHALSGSSRAQKRDASDSNLAAGIVQGKGKVAELQQKQDFQSIHVSFPPGKTDGIQIGASVAINGTCLTVSSHHGQHRLQFVKGPKVQAAEATSWHLPRLESMTVASFPFAFHTVSDTVFTGCSSRCRWLLTL